MNTKLQKPTVKDIIDYLSQFPPETPFRIEDADTNWTISIIHAHQDQEGKVWFSGEYSEMGDD